MPVTSPIAVVTGAGSGIGRAVTLGFLRAGYAVVLAGRRLTTLLDTVAIANVEAERTRCLITDVADAVAVEQLFKGAHEQFGRVDVLFNNAGIGAPAMSIDELRIEQWRAVVETNLNGAFYCAREAFKMMRAQSPQGGRIINNGSISAQVPRPGTAAYTATLPLKDVGAWTYTGSLDLVVKDGTARGIVVRDLLTGEVTSHSAHAVVLATGGYRAGRDTDAAHSFRDGSR